MLNRMQIEGRVPHAGAMCLLNSVSEWDAANIVCHASAPDTDHPLRHAQAVPSIAAVEYAAQAAAVHGSLLDCADRPRSGMLVKLNEIELGSGAISGALVIRATLEGRVASACSYSFAVHEAETCCARGRLMIAFLP
jgi:predicted hotdog family 3-hydroxylacyl-ACP dehydratase